MTAQIAQPSRRSVLLRGGRGLSMALPLVAWLAGCSLNDAPRREFHVLRDTADQAAAKSAVHVDRVLLVAPVSAPTLYDGDRMVYSADGSSRSYFQYGFWSERAPRALGGLAEKRLARSGAFRAVASSTAGVRGSLLLNLRMEALYMDASQPAAPVHLAISAELVDWRSRQLLERQHFNVQVDTPTRDAAGMAAAAGMAVARLLDELVAWSTASAANAPD